MDPIRIAETAYARVANESIWLDALSQASRPLLDDGGGVISLVYDATDPEWIAVRAVSSLGVDPSVAGTLLNLPSERGPQSRALVRIFRESLVSTADKELKRTLPIHRDHYDKTVGRAGLGDARLVNATDPSYTGVGFIAPSARRKGWSPREVHRWSRLASHIAAGLRIQLRQQRASGSAGPSPEAIVRPGGRVEHAEGAARHERAREVLSRSAIALDRARGPLRRADADEALGIWEGLVAGRWTLVDHFDSDGRRYIFAHRNDPDAPDVRGLTLRQRQVLGYAASGHSNKVISYELGLAPSTVASHLTRATEKLGLSSLAAIREFLEFVPGGRG